MSDARLFVGPYEVGAINDLGPLTPGQVDDALSFGIQQAAHIAKRLAAETERWVMKAIERGPGWTVWRSDPTYEIGAIKHDFMLVPPGGGHPRGGVRLAPKSAE